MTTMFARHRVGDFSKWKQTYDGFRPMQQRMGVTAQTVYRSSEDPSEVTVMHEFATLDAARAFVQSDELRDAMERAGATGEPTIWFADRV